MTTTLRARLAANRDLVAAFVLVVTALVTSALRPTGAVWLPIALPLLLVFPGYVTVAFAYAARGRERWTVTTVTKRLGFAVGGSLAVLPVVAILTYLSPLSLAPHDLVTTVSGYVMLGVIATAVRRDRASDSTGEGRRARTPERSGAVRSFGRASPLQLAMGVSVVVAVATLGVAVAVPSDGATTSDLHLLTEQDGRLVADGYPDSVPEDGAVPIVVGVSNDERQPMEYTVVAELQRVSVTDRTVAVQERRELDRYTVELEHGETRRRQLDIRGAFAGEDVRFAVYLYRGEPPASPTAESAYRNAHIWLTVEPTDET